MLASPPTDMVLAGDDGIERKIPVGQIKSVEYANSTSGALAPTPSKEAARPKTVAKAQPGAIPSVPVQQEPSLTPTPSAADRPAQPAAPPPPPVTTKTYELPAGGEISVRTNEPIDSGEASAGQSFEAQVTRDAVDASGDA